MSNEKKSAVERLAAADEFDPARLASVTTLPYHPAAQAYYEEAGIWGGE